MGRVDDATVGSTLDRKTINDLPLVNRNPFDLAFLAPGVSQSPGGTYGNGVSTPGFAKLTVVHDDFEPGSTVLEGVSQGWPQILSSLKTLLETGDILPAGSPKAAAR